MMHTTRLLLFLLSIVSVKSDECSSTKSNVPSIKLKNDLLCGYDKNTRPVQNHKDTVHIIIKMVLGYFVYEPHDSTFSIDCWMVMFWRDEHLAWHPGKYNSITKLHLTSEEIWFPDISVFNRRDYSGSPAAVDSTTCRVFQDGQVICAPQIHKSSLCVGDLTKYPFDTQNCTIRFGSWVHSGEEMNITLGDPAIITEDLVPNGEWTLVDTQVIRHPGKYKCCPSNTYPSINFSFMIRRLAGAHAATVILPALALTLLTLISLWIPPDHSNRLALCCVNLLCHFLYLQYVSSLVPKNGDKIPLILLFARDSLLLSAFATAFSVVLKNLLYIEQSAPNWITRTVSVLMMSKSAQFIRLDDSPMQEVIIQEEGGIGSDTKPNSVRKTWSICVNILDRLCFLIYLVVYVIMLVSFSP